MIRGCIESLIKKLVKYDHVNLYPLVNEENLKKGVESRFESKEISLHEWKFK
jgi:hypothetical protein